MDAELAPKSNCQDAPASPHWQKVHSCVICGGTQFSAVLSAYDPHYGNQGTFPVVRCSGCGLHFLDPAPTMAYLNNAYPPTYYAYGAAFPKTPRQRAIKKLKRILRTLLGFHAAETGDPTFDTPGSVLDVGCGNGIFLAQMREKGWTANGVEIDRNAAKRGQSEGLDIFAGTLEEARYPAAHFDYIRSNHSFEHISDPRSALREMRRIIKPSGRLFIGIPNVEGLMAQLWGRYWWYLGAPVHPFGYSPATLRRLLAQEGFVVERVRYNSTFAGIFGSLQIYLNRHNGKPSERGWIFANPALMVLGHWCARIVDVFHAGDCIEVTARPCSE